LHDAAARATSFENGHHTIKEFVRSAFGKCWCNWQLQWELTGFTGIDPVSIIHPTNYEGLFSYIFDSFNVAVINDMCQ
jgi:hypothetical protein